MQAVLSTGVFREFNVDLLVNFLKQSPFLDLPGLFAAIQSRGLLAVEFEDN